MGQTSWFDFVKKERDPVYEQLKKLTDNHTKVQIGPYTITLNHFDLIEIEGEGIHDCASSLEQCYHYLCEYSK